MERMAPLNELSRSENKISPELTIELIFFDEIKKEGSKAISPTDPPSKPCPSMIGYAESCRL